jgi:hypothetical protein
MAAICVALSLAVGVRLALVALRVEASATENSFMSDVKIVSTLGGVNDLEDVLFFEVAAGDGDCV